MISNILCQFSHVVSGSILISLGRIAQPVSIHHKLDNLVDCVFLYSTLSHWSGRLPICCCAFSELRLLFRSVCFFHWLVLCCDFGLTCLLQSNDSVLGPPSITTAFYRSLCTSCSPLGRCIGLSEQIQNSFGILICMCAKRHLCYAKIAAYIKCRILLYSSVIVLFSSLLCSCNSSVYGPGHYGDALYQFPFRSRRDVWAGTFAAVLSVCRKSWLVAGGGSFRGNTGKETVLLGDAFLHYTHEPVITYKVLNPAGGLSRNVWVLPQLPSCNAQRMPYWRNGWQSLSNNPSQRKSTAN